MIANEKKIKIIAIVIIVFLGIYIGHIYIKMNNKSSEIQSIKSIEIKEVKPIKIIKFSEFEVENCTCTGFSYDTSNNTFLIADCGLSKKSNSYNPRIIILDQYLRTVVDEICLSHVICNSDNLQGIAYDPKDDSIWLAIENNVIQVNKNGVLTKSIFLDNYIKYRPNGICVDIKDESIWILCAYKHILHYDKNGVLMNTLDFNFTYQDQICIYNDSLFITIGADYKGENNFVCKISTESGSIEDIYRVQQSYAIEGLLIQNNRLLILNDGLYHDALIPESYVSVFSMEDL